MKGSFVHICPPTGITCSCHVTSVLSKTASCFWLRFGVQKKPPTSVNVFMFETDAVRKGTRHGGIYGLVGLKL